MADVEKLSMALTVEEKALLTAGGGMMSTAAIERLGIPAVAVTDGPNGARGPSYPGIGGPASTCIPCGTALGATWDQDLVEALGALLGREAFDRGCQGLLAPTVNLHRSPLAGRNFECFSEDPLLTGKLAAAYVRGVQSNTVFATVKHFVGNETEYERLSMSSVIDARSLREIYLLPFEMAVKEGGTLGLMTSYNRLNGKWLSEQHHYLSDILRGEWGFRGFVMTDWFAIADSKVSLGAGLDLEMPGPGRALGEHVIPFVREGAVSEVDLDSAVQRLLGGLNQIGALDRPAPPCAPKDPDASDLALLRRASVEGTVLLSNDGVLPLDPLTPRRVLVVGDHALLPTLSGGGSARVVQRPTISFYSALERILGSETELRYERGCEVDRDSTVVGGSVLDAPDGFVVEVHDGLEFAGEVIHTTRVHELRVFVFDSSAQGYPKDAWSMRIRGSIVPRETGTFRLALSQLGRARVLIDGVVVLDGFENPPAAGGVDFFGRASLDLTKDIAVVADEPFEVTVEYARVETITAGVRVGFRTLGVDNLMDRAVANAAQADVVLAFVGTTHEWETEGRDRKSLQLPGRQDELLRRLAAANPRTIVTVNAGAPVDMSWADDVSAVLQCWFGGDEMASAVADILTGRAEPGGRLPTTIPIALEHSPSHDNFPGENGEVRYGEGLYMGYRGYEHRGITPRYPFGHGLGYTAFEFGELRMPNGFTVGETVVASLEVTNIGTRHGSTVVQCYVSPDTPRLHRPQKELKAFARVHLDAGASTFVDLVLNDRCFAYWDPGQPDWEETTARFTELSEQAGAHDRRSPGWQIDPGTYEILVGRSSADIVSRARIALGSV